MRVVHFAEALKGGPATYLNTLFSFQVGIYERVSLFCPRSQAHLIDCAGVEIVPFPDTGRTPLGVARLLRHWHRYISANSHDIVHLHSSFAGLAGRLAPRCTTAKIIYCPHGWAFAMDTAPTRKRLYALVEQLLARRTDAIINISANEAKLAAWAGISAPLSAMIHNGVENAPWQPPAPGRKPTRLLFVGRYDYQKGIDIAAMAMPRLSAQGFTLTVIGGPVVGRSPVSTFAPHITDMGWSSPEKVAAAMAKADIVVMPSRWEGFSLVALEAMRAGRPIVAAEVSSLPEAVIDGETGVLYAPNSPDALTRAVLRLAAMDVAQLGRNARKRYEERFTAERMFRATAEVYARLRNGAAE